MHPDRFIKASEINTPVRALTSDDVDSGLSLLSMSKMYTGKINASQATLNDTLSITHACRQEAGYKTLPTGYSASIHPENEDVSHTEDRLFILADGHGGKQAPDWFVKEARIRFASMLDRQLDNEDERTIFTKECTHIFQVMDEDYLEIKRTEYQAFLSNTGPKPIDDGCTLNISIISNGWLINMNVGDSRAVLGVCLKNKLLAAPLPIQNYQHKYAAHTFSIQPSSSTNKTSISTLFASCDHNMTHPHKINHIAEKNGAFITNTSPIKFHRIQPPSTRAHRPYSELIGARIYIPHSPLPYLSNRRTLNLSSTMGDLLFKPTLSSIPDIRFVKLEKGIKHLLCMGTDGVWDHLQTQSSQDLQNSEFLNHIHEQLLTNTLENVCQDMTNREKGIYVKEQQMRIDDVTVILALFEV